MNLRTTIWILLVFSVGCFAQETTLPCQFSTHPFMGYTCILNRTEVTDEAVVFTGEHADGMDNDNVQSVSFVQSTLSRVPMEIFDVFPNTSTITVVGAGLEQLNRFSNCESLRNFFARNNELQTIPVDTFEECTNLELLDLSENQIGDFHARGIENLRELRLNNNNLRLFNNDTFGVLTNLQVLLLSNNQIELINPIMFASQRNLLQLELDFNRINRVFAGEFSSLINLQRLSLSNNGLSTIHPTGLMGLFNLLHLDLSINSLVDITGMFSNTPSLQTLVLSNNTISSIGRDTFQNNTDLVTIDLSNNGIVLIHENVFDNLSHLVNLNFLENPCANESLSIYPPGNISGILPKLEVCLIKEQVTLNCRFAEHVAGYTCWILSTEVRQGLPVVVITDHPNPERNNSHVVAVRFFGSTLSHIPLEILEVFPNVELLDVATSRLPAINPLRNCSNLQRFDGSLNFITNVEANMFSECSNLRRITLINNDIRNITLSGLPNLESLELNYNNISEITSENFMALGRLQELNLASNNLASIDLQVFRFNLDITDLILNYNQIRVFNSSNPLKNLRVLSLRGNQIQSFDDNSFANFTNLQSLTLSFNQIRSFGNSLAPLTSLRTLLADGNQIVSLESGVFQNNTNLYEIDLEYNNITTIHPEAFTHLRELNYLRLIGNQCASINFYGIGGDVEAILNDLENCFTSEEIDDMICSFVSNLGGYSCQVGNNIPFLVRTIRFN